MFLLFTLAVLVLILAFTGRIGPFVWAGRPLGRPGGEWPTADYADSPPRPRPASPNPGPTPEEIVAQRLADGQISPDEYRELVSVLRGS